MTSLRNNARSNFFVAQAPKVVLLCAPQMIEIGKVAPAATVWAL